MTLTHQQQHREQLAKAMQRKLINRILREAVGHWDEGGWKRRAYMLCYGASLRFVLTGKKLNDR